MDHGRSGQRLYLQFKCGLGFCFPLHRICLRTVKESKCARTLNNKWDVCVAAARRGKPAGDLYTRLEWVCSIKTPSSTRCAVRHHSALSKHGTAKKARERKTSPALFSSFAHGFSLPYLSLINIKRIVCCHDGVIFRAWLFCQFS